MKIFDIVTLLEGTLTDGDFFDNQGDLSHQ